MTDKVDVLAVMDRNGFICGDLSSEISQVRAAVTELLDAAPSAVFYLSGDADLAYGWSNAYGKSEAKLARERADFLEAKEEAIARFRAALARVSA